MKKIMIFLLFAAFSVAAHATVRTVSNYDSAAQYRTIQAAIDASSAGDSVYVNGSPYNYAGFVVDKKLAIFGPGWSPDKDVVYVANIKDQCYIRASDCEIHGLTFLQNLRINDAATGASNVKFIRNKFQGNYVYLYYSFSNALFQGNWFDNAVLQFGGFSGSDMTIRNNIFYSNSNNSVQYLGVTNTLFEP